MITKTRAVFKIWILIQRPCPTPHPHFLKPQVHRAYHLLVLPVGKPKDDLTTACSSPFPIVLNKVRVEDVNTSVSAEQWLEETRWLLTGRDTLHGSAQHLGKPDQAATRRCQQWIICLIHLSQLTDLEKTTFRMYPVTYWCLQSLQPKKTPTLLSLNHILMVKELNCVTILWINTWCWAGS